MKKMILSVTSDYEVLNSLKLENEFFVDIKDVTESDLNLVKRLKNIHRYIKILGSKTDVKKILKDLKYKIYSYPKDGENNGNSSKNERI